MKCDFSFKHLDTSQALMEFSTQHLSHIEKYLLKSGRAHIEFSRNHKHDCVVEVTIQSGSGYFKAHSHAENFQAAVIFACDKLEKQFLKNRKLHQKHKSMERSKTGRFALINDQLEHNFENLKHPKKVA